MESFDAVALWPAGEFAVAVCCRGESVVASEYLSPPSAAVPRPRGSLGREVLRQLKAYFVDPKFRFDLPLAPAGTETQKRIWRCVAAVASGEARAYKDIAAAAGTSPRVVGNACRANPLPLFVPCHRVVAAGGIGGFMGGDNRSRVDIKRALLRHENAL